MIESLPFQTRARTIDHLGREQIADCPTAISELWKNAYDAYASKVELHLYDGEVPVAAIVDDGHGMSRDEFVSKWLVVGTESKTSNKNTPEEDRNGFERRISQGQKGIGRLSCANLAPLLLLVSKRKNHSCVASLLDWRLFENPYLILSDIKIPVVEFDNPDDVLDYLPALFDQLLTNLWGEPPSNDDDKTNVVLKEEHKKRVEAAWSAYDAYISQQAKQSGKVVSIPSAEIENTLISTAFSDLHFKQWPVWKKNQSHGTILLMANLHYDLRVMLKDTVVDVVEADTKDKFFETLSSFIDPFLEQGTRADYLKGNMLTYSVTKWVDDVPSLILGSSENVNLSDLKDMEHIVSGRINHEGVFIGRIKSFGKWYDDIEFSPPNDLKIPTTAKTQLGPVDIYFATVEQLQENTTHTDAQRNYYIQLQEKYSGLMIHRDGLRVLPYGRTDADYFDIEQRRGRNAGTAFWTYRRMFGRLGISRKLNPNINDKAGREGMLDNVSAKTLKSLVINILQTSADRYFGRQSSIRREIKPKLNVAHREQKAEEARKKKRQVMRNKFRSNLKKKYPLLESLVESSSVKIDAFDYSSELTLDKNQEYLDSIRADLKEYVLGDVPTNLGEELNIMYERFSSKKLKIKGVLDEAQFQINEALEKISKTSPKQHAEKQIERHKRLLKRDTSSFKSRIQALLAGELKRIGDLIQERQGVFENKATPLLVQIDQGALDLHDGLNMIEELRESIEEENSALFEPYIGALESLSESIDLEAMAVFGMDKVSELSAEIDRLNSLAQLGIAIEIIGHELQSYDDLIGSGIRDLPKSLANTDAYLSIETGYEGLTDQLRFLSPLKLSGNKVQRWITGKDIYQYVSKFFGHSFDKNGIKFIASDEFKSFRVYDQPSRLYPVFINLVNNSRYWVANHKTEDKQIILDVRDRKVVVSDNGPGVAQSDQKSLFTLFFSKKQKGGRGVGLYLSRANLTAGGHKIDYGTDKDYPLDGANFIINFRGAEYV